MVMLNSKLHIFQLHLTLNQFHIQTPLWLNQLMIMRWIISCNSSIQNMMKIFWMLTSRCFNIDWWCPLLQFFTVSTVLFHKYVGAYVAVTNCMSHFSMLSPTKANVKMANENMVHAQGIGIVLFCFPNCLIIYIFGPVYYFPGHPSNTISSGALKFYVGFKIFTSEPLEHCDFVKPQYHSFISPYQTQKNL